MKYADEINEIASRWIEMGFDAPDSVHVGPGVYTDMLAEAAAQNGHTVTGIRTITFYSMFGDHKIIPDKTLPRDMIHMNRLTLNDILIDDILLDDPDFDIFDD